MNLERGRKLLCIELFINKHAGIDTYPPREGPETYSFKREAILSFLYRYLSTSRGAGTALDFAIRSAFSSSV